MRLCVTLKIFAFLLLLTSGMSGFAQFYRDYPPGLSKQLAESYYLAGLTYAKLGNDVGARLQRLARAIFPALNPAAIVTPAPRAWNARPVVITEKPPATAEANEIVAAFEACVQAYKAGDIDGAIAYFHDEIGIVPLGSVITRDEAALTFRGFIEDGVGNAGAAGGFALNPARTIVKRAILPSRLASPVARAIKGFSRDVFSLHPVFEQTTTGDLPFFTDYSEFYFARIEGRWVLVGIR